MAAIERLDLEVEIQEVNIVCFFRQIDVESIIPIFEQEMVTLEHVDRHRYGLLGRGCQFLCLGQSVGELGKWIFVATSSLLAILNRFINKVAHIEVEGSDGLALLVLALTCLSLGIHDA